MRTELSWTHYCTLLRVEYEKKARRWYMDETAAQNWSLRVLERDCALLEAAVPVKRGVVK